uniref:EF-hand domain-containing protein n=1 Tax=Chromera velia CCMP2878 TaxID=1169474 RepID=A0A0G4GZ16_9ALVE|eukprot:Cvel_23946.t1-p1 / transcript=Cvel_23946.t1 / gene=Cvel_23946 / organism=Chromera_velia_CCMP2878 / gene_product=hypothetical protein / transcript_product=hypothetical protein / location=Cvel_scaffold2531:9660-20141(+) / protein_length=885 / sequence_SO=supercontig / SO=protein_coding / is_pseudo=false
MCASETFDPLNHFADLDVDRKEFLSVSDVLSFLGRFTDDVTEEEAKQLCRRIRTRTAMLEESLEGQRETDVNAFDYESTCICPALAEHESIAKVLLAEIATERLLEEKRKEILSSLGAVEELWNAFDWLDCRFDRRRDAESRRPRDRRLSFEDFVFAVLPFGMDVEDAAGIGREIEKMRKEGRVKTYHKCPTHKGMMRQAHGDDLDNTRGNDKSEFTTALPSSLGGREGTSRSPRGVPTPSGSPSSTLKGRRQENERPGPSSHTKQLHGGHSPASLEFSFSSKQNSSTPPKASPPVDPSTRPTGTSLFHVNLARDTPPIAPLCCPLRSSEEKVLCPCECCLGVCDDCAIAFRCPPPCTQTPNCLYTNANPDGVNYCSCFQPCAVPSPIPMPTIEPDPPPQVPSQSPSPRTVPDSPSLPSRPQRRVGGGLRRIPGRSAIGPGSGGWPIGKYCGSCCDNCKEPLSPRRRPPSPKTAKELCAHFPFKREEWDIWRASRGSPPRSPEVRNRCCTHTHAVTPTPNSGIWTPGRYPFPPVPANSRQPPSPSPMTLKKEENAPPPPPLPPLPPATPESPPPPTQPPKTTPGIESPPSPTQLPPQHYWYPPCHHTLPAGCCCCHCRLPGCLPPMSPGMPPAVHSTTPRATETVDKAVNTETAPSPPEAVPCLPPCYAPPSQSCQYVFNESPLPPLPPCFPQRSCESPCSVPSAPPPCCGWRPASRPRKPKEKAGEKIEGPSHRFVQETVEDIEREMREAEQEAEEDKHKQCLFLLLGMSVAWRPSFDFILQSSSCPLTFSCCEGIPWECLYGPSCNSGASWDGLEVGCPLLSLRKAFRRFQKHQEKRQSRHQRSPDADTRSTRSLDTVKVSETVAVVSTLGGLVSVTVWVSHL